MAGGSSRLSRRAGVATAAMLTGLVFLSGGCASSAPRRFPDPPPPRDLRPALVSMLGDEPGLKIAGIDGVPVEQLGPTTVLRFAGDASPGKEGILGFWLSPALHHLHAQFVRNIEGGISLVQGELHANLLPGHTYLIHPDFTTDRGKVSLTVVDYGAGFPVACLPASISLAKPNGKGSRLTRFTHDEIVACQRAGGR